MERKLCILWLMASLLTACIGCGGNAQMKDGYYTAEMSDFEYGWKEYVCIYVKNDRIISAEFNAKDPNGFIKAWDNEYMNAMSSVQGTYPNRYTREYVQQLIEGQKETEVEAVSGATSSGANFKLLVPAVIEQAKKGDASVVVVTEEP